MHLIYFVPKNSLAQNVGKETPAWIEMSIVWCWHDPVFSPALLEWSLCPGGYKGYGLGMMVEVFCGILSGAQYSKHVRTWKVTDRAANLVRYTACWLAFSFDAVDISDFYCYLFLARLFSLFLYYNKINKWMSNLFFIYFRLLSLFINLHAFLCDLQSVNGTMLFILHKQQKKSTPTNNI